MIQVTLKRLTFLQVLNRWTAFFNGWYIWYINPDWTEKKIPRSSQALKKKTNQANTLIHERRTGPCGYRTHFSQTPSVRLPPWYATTCMHPSWKLNCWRPSSPLRIPLLLATLQSGLLKKCPAHSTFYTQGNSSTVDTAVESVFNMCWQKDTDFCWIFVQTGRWSSSKHN